MPPLGNSAKRKRKQSARKDAKKPQITLKHLWGIVDEESRDSEKPPDDEDSINEDSVNEDSDNKKVDKKADKNSDEPSQKPDNSDDFCEIPNPSEHTTRSHESTSAKPAAINPFFSIMMANQKRLSNGTDSSAKRGRKKGRIETENSNSTSTLNKLPEPSESISDVIVLGSTTSNESEQSVDIEEVFLPVEPPILHSTASTAPKPTKASEIKVLKTVHPFFTRQTRSKEANALTLAPAPAPVVPRILPKSTLDHSSFLATYRPHEIATPWPSFSQIHVRGEVMSLYPHIPLSSLNEKRPNQTVHGSKHENGVFKYTSLKTEPSFTRPATNNGFPVPNIRLPVLSKFTPTQLSELALSVVTRKAHRQILGSLIDNLGAFSAFDRNQYEPRMWTSKYAPILGSAVITADSNGAFVTKWLADKFDSLKKASKREQRSLLKSRKSKEAYADDLDGFIVNDCDDSETETSAAEDNHTCFLILCGPAGSGKTSSVYAAAAELGAFTLELNPSEKRSSKKLFEKLGGMSKSHLVHHGHKSGKGHDEFKQKSVILLDEVDVLFDDDQTFWAGLDKFVEDSRRPIIMTCQDSSLLPATIAENHSESFMQFSHAPASLQADALWLIALHEGHVLDTQAVEQLVRANKSDFRSSLNDIQFWCQMGLGDRKSGINWILTDLQRVKTNQRDIRHISGGTYIGHSVEEVRFDYDSLAITTGENPSLDDWSSCAEALSVADYLRTNMRTQFETNLAEEYLTDRVLGLGELTELPVPAEPFPYELSVYPTIASIACDIYSTLIEILDYEPEVTANMMRASLDFLKGSGTSYSCVDTSSTTVLVSELLPVVRTMVRADEYKESQSEEIFKNRDVLSTRRAKLATLASLGIDPNSLKRHFDFDGDFKDVLDTAPVLI